MDISKPSFGPCFFVGIGGSGMMPLAMILAGRGATVAGSDRSLDQGRVPAKFADLEAKGIALFPQDGSGIVSADQLVIASAAIEPTVADMIAADALGCPRATRAAMLASLFNDSRLPIGIAGTSGKSTVTGMIGWILHVVGRDPTVMNGAVMKNFATPDAPFASALVGAGGSEGGGSDGGVFVSEVDESDGSIASYSPRIAVLNNVSLDHKSLDELRALFGGFIAKAETAVVNVGDPDAAALAAKLPRGQVMTVAIDASADLRAENLQPEPFAIRFDLVSRGVRTPVRLAVPGRHNVANALAAIGAAIAADVPLADAVKAIAGFTGLRRRFEFVGEARGVAVIDDFGHNPDKIAATLDTLHAFPGHAFPGHAFPDHAFPDHASPGHDGTGRLLLLFQPHGYGPLKVMGRELVATFVDRMAPDDVLVLPDPAYYGGTVTREVTSADIVAQVVAGGRDARHVADRADAAASLVAAARPGDRIVVMGARDDTLSLLAAGMVESLAG